MFKFIRLLCAVLAIANASSVLVRAQEGVESETDRLTIEEIIVTATKREESAQEIPISMQIFDADALEVAHINSLIDLTSQVPGFQIRPFPTAPENLTFVIRGVRDGAIELTQDSSTAIHLNGVYIARSNGLNISVVDMERIEILRGPQGTLYGRNATAGAVNLVTAKPDLNAFAISQQFTGGNLGRILSKTSLNIPLSDSLGMRVAYLYDTKDGYVENTGQGEEFGDRAAQSLRFDLRWQLSEVFTADYSYDWNSVDYVPYPPQCEVQLSTTARVPGVDDVDCFTGFRDRLEASFDYPESHVENSGHSLIFEWKLGQRATIRSVAGYREMDDEYTVMLSPNGPRRARIDGGPIRIEGSSTGMALLDFPAMPTLTEHDQFSWELQFLGDLSESLSYVAGVFYLNEEGTLGPGVGVIGHSVSTTTGLGPGQQAVILAGRRVEAENRSWATFAQLNIRPPVWGERLEVIPGVRYTEDRREAFLWDHSNDFRIIVPAADLVTQASPAVIKSVRTQAKFSEWTPELTFRYHWTGEVMTYARISRGYKSGGFAERASTAEVFERGFAPETLLSYEIGLRSDWMDGRLRFNATAFHYDFEDQQLSVRPPGGTNPSVVDVLNAGESTTDGFELDFVILVSENLRLSATYAYLDGEYDRVTDGNGMDVTNQFEFTAPKHTYSATLHYEFPDFGFGKMEGNLLYSFVDDTRESTPPPTTRQGHGLLQARLALSEIALRRGALQLALWGKNLTDKEYWFNAYNLINADVVTNYGEPRTYGVDLVWRY